MSVITFGKFKGRTYPDLPFWYLRWMIAEGHSKSDLAQAELQRRLSVAHAVLIDPPVLARLKESQKRAWERTRRPRESFPRWVERLATAALGNALSARGRYALPGFVFTFDEDGELPRLVDIVQKREYVP